MTYIPPRKQLLFTTKHSLRGRKIRSSRLLRITQKKQKNLKEKETDHQNIQQKQLEPHQNVQSSNSVPFPSTKDNQADHNPQDEDQLPDDQYGQGKRNRPPLGAFKAMNKGLTAAIMVTTDDDDDNIQEQLENIDGYLNCFNEYPPNVALVGQNTTDPRNLNEALHGPNAKEWREALQYKHKSTREARNMESQSRNDTNTM